MFMRSPEDATQAMLLMLAQTYRALCGYAHFTITIPAGICAWASPLMRTELVSSLQFITTKKHVVGFLNIFKKTDVQYWCCSGATADNVRWARHQHWALNGWQDLKVKNLFRQCLVLDWTWKRVGYCVNSLPFGASRPAATICMNNYIRRKHDNNLSIVESFEISAMPHNVPFEEAIVRGALVHVSVAAFALEQRLTANAFDAKIPFLCVKTEQMILLNVKCFLDHGLRRAIHENQRIRTVARCGRTHQHGAEAKRRRFPPSFTFRVNKNENIMLEWSQVIWSVAIWLSV